MFEADPIAMVQFANTVVQMPMQAGPPADLPAQVPEFVWNILSEVSSAAGSESGGLGEQISALTPGGSEAADSASAAAENAGSDAANGRSAAANASAPAEQAADAAPVR